MAKQTIPSIIINALAVSGVADSNQLHHIVETKLGKRYPKAFVDRTLSRITDKTDGRVLKDKNKMTDTNTTSHDSKYIYFLP